MSDYCLATKREAKPRTGQTRRHVAGRGHLCVDAIAHPTLDHRCHCGHLWPV